MKWHKISEQPPPFDRGILITDGEDVITAEAKEVDSAKYFFREYGLEIYGCGEIFLTIDQNKVTHWSELPNPPAE